MTSPPAADRRWHGSRRKQSKKRIMPLAAPLMGARTISAQSAMVFPLLTIRLILDMAFALRLCCLAGVAPEHGERRPVGLLLLTS